MRLLPRTLLWRTVLLLALLLVAAQAAWLMLNRMVERDLRARQISHLAVSVANVTRSALVASHPERRRYLLAELAEREGIRIYPTAERSPEATRREPPVLELVRSQVREGLGPDTEVVLDRGRPRALWLSLDIEGERYWLVLSGARVDRPFAWRWAGWATVVLLLSLAGAYLLVRRINRPLRSLTAAATALGRGEAPAALPEVGPVEVRTVTQAFNQMTGDLKRLETERTLMLAGVSHDLRTRLGRLRLAVEMMPDHPAKPGVMQDIEDMDATVGPFLALAREGASEDTYLNVLVRAACERYAGAGNTVATDLQPAQSLRASCATIDGPGPELAPCPTPTPSASAATVSTTSER